MVRRAFDPPLPLSVSLLGRRRPLEAPLKMPWAERRAILDVIRAAVGKLEAEHRAGLLGPADRRYLAAIKRFEFGRGRSGAWRGAFIVGLKDARASQDPTYWSAGFVHDGVHLWLQARGRPFWDETRPCLAQIDYMLRTGAPPHHIAAVERFMGSRALQKARYRETA